MGGAALAVAAAAALIAGCASGRPPDGGEAVWDVDHAYAGDPVEVRLRVDRLRITTAQVIRVEVAVDAPEGVAVRLPGAEGFAGGGFDVELSTEPPALTGDRRTLHVRRYRLEPFLAGDYLIPALEVGWTAPGQEAASLSTEALEAEVISVLGAGEDGTGSVPELREVGAPAPAPAASEH